MTASQPKVTLREALASALPSGQECRVRYLHTPSKPCDPLFSPPPGHEPEKTRLASHFLTVSGLVNKSSIDERAASAGPESEVLTFAIELLVYSTKYLTTLFISKADTTGFTSSAPRTPTKAICTTFLQWLVDQERRKHPTRQLVVSLFARAQSQYLFPGSVEHGNKHVLDDRQLIKWWATALDPLLDSQGEKSADEAERPDVTGHLVIPGYDEHDLRSYFPRRPVKSESRWRAGHPLESLAEGRGLPRDVPPRCLLPRFPDDPKARFIEDLDGDAGLSSEAINTVSPSKRKNGNWNNIRDLQRFWEAMEFRQECSSGRVVGFLWVVISPKPNSSAGADAEAGESQESSQGLQQIDEREGTPTPSQSISPRKRRRKPLTGPIVARQPRLKGGSSSLSATSSGLNAMVTESGSGEGLLVTREGYDQAMRTLLQLDFANLDIATQSTNKWLADVRAEGDWSIDVVGTARAANAGTLSVNAGSQVNDLGSMIRKKRKAAETPNLNASQVLAQAEVQSVGTDSTAINVLGAGMVRKKPKPA